MAQTTANSLYDIPLRTLQGQDTQLGAYAGKVLLIVNTASRCGLTPQYEGLEALRRRYHERGFEILGFPCNQFRAQEPGSAEEIATFCRSTYDLSFPLFEKTEVNGAHAHPLYRELKRRAPGLLGIEAIKWNFTKFLLNREGEVVSRFAPIVAPERIAKAIEALL